MQTHNTVPIPAIWIPSFCALVIIWHISNLLEIQSFGTKHFNAVSEQSWMSHSTYFGDEFLQAIDTNNETQQPRENTWKTNYTIN